MTRSFLQRCACGGTAEPGGECAACKAKRLSLQRMPVAAAANDVAPPSVTSVLARPGRPLDGATRKFMETRFGHDFSRVRVHDDTEAAESAREVSARAYTVGSHVVVGGGEPGPSTTAGRALLAHELTHVLQQGGTAPDGAVDVRPSDDEYERESQRVAARVVAASSPAHVHVRTLRTTGMQRYSFGTGGPLALAGGRRFLEPTEDQRRRIDEGLRIVARVIANPRDYPACPRFFRTNCPGGTATSLQDAFNRVTVWFQEGAPPDVLATTRGLGGTEIGFTPLILRIGRWAIAASFIHELMHVCGQADHDIGDAAKEACGRLPDIISISPRIEISNPL